MLVSVSLPGSGPCLVMLCGSWSKMLGDVFRAQGLRLPLLDVKETHVLCLGCICALNVRAEILSAFSCLGAL